MDLIFEVINSGLSRLDKEHPTTDSVGYLKAVFNILTTDWQGLTPTVIFATSEGVAEPIILDDTLICDVPPEVIVGKEFAVAIVGMQGTEKILPTNPVMVPLVQSGYVSGQTIPTPTPDVYAQILSLLGLKADGLKYEDSILKLMSGEQELARVTITGGSGGGREIELRNSGTYIQWHYVGDIAWIDLVSIADLKGDPGLKGDDGLSAYELAVLGGFEGTEAEWLLSLKGDPGADAVITDGSITEQKLATEIQEKLNNRSASNVTITDTNNYFTSDNVEGALSETGLRVDELANSFIWDFEFIAHSQLYNGSLNSGAQSTLSSQSTGANHFGMSRFTSSANANSGFYFHTVTGSYTSNLQELKQTGVFRTRSTLNTVVARFGFSSSFNNVADTSNEIFLYLDGSGLLGGANITDGVKNVTNTSYNLQTTTFYRYQIEILSSTQVKFTLYEDNTNNVIWQEILIVPSVSATAGRCGFHTYSTGTTAIDLLDFDYIRVYRPNQRKVW